MAGKTRRGKGTVLTLALFSPHGWYRLSGDKRLHLRSQDGDEGTVCRKAIFMHAAELGTMTDKLDEKVDPTTVEAPEFCRTCLTLTISRGLFRIDKVVKE